MRNPFRMPSRVSDRHRAALGNSQQWKAFDARGFDYRLKVLHPGSEREIGAVPVRETVATLVIANEGVIARELSQQVTPDRTAPLKFEMAEPVSRLQQRWPLAHLGVGDAGPIGSGAKMDGLFHEKERTSESDLS